MQRNQIDNGSRLCNFFIAKQLGQFIKIKNAQKENKKRRQFVSECGNAKDIERQSGNPKWKMRFIQPVFAVTEQIYPIARLGDCLGNGSIQGAILIHHVGEQRYRIYGYSHNEKNPEASIKIIESPSIIMGFF